MLVVGIVLGIFGTLAYRDFFPAPDPINHYPIYVAKSARSLISGSDCVMDADGNIWISGTVSAPADSGILKIGGFANYGNSGQSKFPNNAVSVPTYFDTYDPAYQDNLTGTFSLEVVVNSTSDRPKYCWVTAHYM